MLDIKILFLTVIKGFINRTLLQIEDEEVLEALADAFDEMLDEEELEEEMEHGQRLTIPV